MRNLAPGGLFLALVLGAACGERHPAPAGPAAETDAEDAKQPADGSGAAREPTATPSARIEGAFPPQVAGAFYPDDPGELRDLVRGFVDAAQPAAAVAGRDVVGVLSPHAGYRYSGPIAGASYRALAGRDLRTVVVMALSHRRAAAKAALLDNPAYDTPLGSLPIDTRIVRRLLDDHGDQFAVDAGMFRGEHSLEVQLPFVQVALPGAKVVPIIVAVQDEDQIARIGAALHESLGRRGDLAFVLSSDLSHHFPYAEAQRYDALNLELLEQWKIDEWREQAAQGREGMCGYRPLLAFARMFERYPAARRRVTRLDYRNSGDTAGDKTAVVGYGSLAFSLEQGMRNERGSEQDFGPYDAALRRELMQLAKRAVAAAVKGEQFEPPTPSSALLAAKGAAFVTLKKQGHLRGCIGHVIARVPLYECVADVARSAAIHDHRFDRVSPDELAELSYEISVLTAPQPIKPADVVVGKHGLIMSRGGRSGLLLPQVPIEWQWDREEFLAHTCRKAGLPLDCWQDPETRIESFEAIVWGEDDLQD